MLKLNHYAFNIAYHRAILDFEGNRIFNGYPLDSIEFKGYQAGLASKGITE